MTIYSGFFKSALTNVKGMGVLVNFQIKDKKLIITEVRKNYTHEINIDNSNLDLKFDLGLRKKVILVSIIIFDFENKKAELLPFKANKSLIKELTKDNINLDAFPDDFILYGLTKRELTFFKTYISILIVITLFIISKSIYSTSPSNVDLAKQYTLLIVFTFLPILFATELLATSYHLLACKDYIWDIKNIPLNYKISDSGFYNTIKKKKEKNYVLFSILTLALIISPFLIFIQNQLPFPIYILQMIFWNIYPIYLSIKSIIIVSRGLKSN